jgi:hypothetical protein
MKVVECDGHCPGSPIVKVKGQEARKSKGKGGCGDELVRRDLKSSHSFPTRLQIRREWLYTCTDKEDTFEPQKVLLVIGIHLDSFVWKGVGELGGRCGLFLKRMIFL